MSQTQLPLTDWNKARAIVLLSEIIRHELCHSAETENQNEDSLKCPYCKSARTIKRGHDSKGKQRYQCKNCERSFTSSSCSILRSTNIPIEVWLRFADCHIQKLSLRASASYCNVSLKTAFFMRRRLVIVIAYYSSLIKKRLKTSSSVSMKPTNTTATNQQKT